MVKMATLRALFLPEWLAQRAFPKADLDVIEAAVAAAEAGHRGEIRVAVDLAPDLADVLRGQSIRARAEMAFARLRVWDTEGNSGVLIYLAWAERQVEIVADRGIAALVPPSAWERICAELTAGCGAGRPTQALVAAVTSVGTLLRTHFPLIEPANPDELPNRPTLG
jgi:uncharacterized membrane protein